MWRSPGGEGRYLANNLQLSYPGGWASLVVRLGLSGTLEVDWQVGGLLIAGKPKMLLRLDRSLSTRMGWARRWWLCIKQKLRTMERFSPTPMEDR